MNYYERHIGDYLKDTAHLSLLEHGVYSRLLDVYYTRECGIDDASAARLIGARSKEERGALESVLDEFFTLTGGIWIHTRCDREIERYQEKRSKAAASANARWSKQEAHSERNANALQTQCDGNAPSHQTPDTNTEPKGSEGARKRAARLPDDWQLPKAWGEWAMKEQPSWTTDHCRQIGMKFGNYWQAKSGKDATKLDWFKTWQNWVITEGPMKGTTPGTQAVPIVSPAIEQTRALIASQALSPEQIEANKLRAAEIRQQLGNVLKVVA